MKQLYSLLFLVLITSASFAQSKNYRMVVKFGSMCCGVPSNAPLLDYIAAFKKKNKIKKIAVDSIGPMGKEGEYDMAFMLKELKPKQQVIFIKEANTLSKTMKEQGYATVEENVDIDLSSLGRASLVKKNL